MPGAINCRLCCLQKRHEDINLPHGVAVRIGRSPLTKIVDPRCSREQVEITADWSSLEVKVKQVGANAASIDGSDLAKNEERILDLQSTLFILKGQYPHIVKFDMKREQEKKNPKDSNTNKEPAKTKVPNGTKIDNCADQKVSQNDTKTTPLAAQKSHKDSKSENLEKSTHKDRKQETPRSANKQKQETSANKQKQETSAKKQSENGKSETRKVSKRQNQDHTEQAVAKKRKTEVSQESSEEDAHDLDMKEKEEKLEKMKAMAAENLSPSNKGSSCTTSSKSIVKEATDLGWSAYKNMHVFTAKKLRHANKIAGFDLDGTIIKTKSGKAFPVDASDWVINYPEIFGKLKKLHTSGVKIVFFTNQLGVAQGKVDLEDLKTKIVNIIRKLQIPIQVFVATHKGKNRKPMDGMWKKLESQHNGGVQIDKSYCVYVGDAAGRPANWAPKKKKDFSNSDRLFAINIGVKFQTPEEYFLNHKKAEFSMPVFDPRALSSDTPVVPSGENLTVRSKEVALLVGYPACGKSFMANKIFKPEGYNVINRDSLGTWQKCVKTATSSLLTSSVVIDNTNLTKEERKRYIECARTANVPCRCILFTTTFEHCKHNERFRELTDPSHAKINDMIFNQAKSKYEQPMLSEGFSEIINVNFVPKFTSSSLEADYRKFLMEK